MHSLREIAKTRRGKNRGRLLLTSGGHRRPMDGGGDIARRAFDAVAAIRSSNDLQELQANVEKSFLHDLGYEMFIGFDSVAANGLPAVNVLFGKEHGKWEEHYLEAGLQEHDPIIKATKSAIEPFFWSDVMDGRRLSAAPKRVMDEATDFGLTNGFVTPMHNPDGSITAVLLTGSHIDPLDPDLRTASHLLSVYLGTCGRRLSRLQHLQNSSIKLSKRQRECLLWTRAGKSAADIGDILSISQRTVEMHLVEACRKLNVRTRIQAVVEAGILGLLEL